MITNQPWFEYLEHRYQQEIEALDDSRLAYQEDKSDGLLIIKVQYPYKDTLYELTAIYPPSYPYFPFSLRSSNLPIGRHLGSQFHDLCVLADIQNTWNSSKDTLAGIIRSQIPKILSDHGLDIGVELYAEEALRPSGFAQYLPDTRVYIGDWTLPAESTYGVMTLALDTDPPLVTPLRGAIIKCDDQFGDLIGEMNYGFLDQFYERSKNRHRHLQVKWVRLPTAPVTQDEALTRISQIFPELKKPRFNKGPDIVGIAFPEESSVTGGEVTNWMFLVRVKVHGRSINGYATYLAKAQYLTADIMRVRSPRAAPLADKKVLLVGLGALGAPLALQLARAGVGELRLLDFDALETGNLTRWLPALGDTGLAKTMAASRLLSFSYPYTKIVEVVVQGANGVIIRPRIGTVNPAEHSAFIQALEGIDLVIDATAERSVSHFISDFAKMSEIPYLWATATPGAWGGVVGRVIPHSAEGCWQCFKRYFNDKENKENLKPPPYEEESSSKIQPKGCFHPTFTGSGFDLDQVSTMAARLAVATLCRGNEGGYPDFDWNVAVLSSWDKVNDKPTLPQWESSRLPRHSECGNHAE